MKFLLLANKNIAVKAEENHMKQEKKQPGKLKMLAGYYKPYRGLFLQICFCISRGGSYPCYSIDGPLYYEFGKRVISGGG